MREYSTLFNVILRIEPKRVRILEFMDVVSTKCFRSQRPRIYAKKRAEIHRRLAIRD